MFTSVSMCVNPSIADSIFDSVNVVLPAILFYVIHLYIFDYIRIWTNECCFDSDIYPVCQIEQYKAIKRFLWRYFPQPKHPPTLHSTSFYQCLMCASMVIGFIVSNLIEIYLLTVLFPVATSTGNLLMQFKHNLLIPL